MDLSRIIEKYKKLITVKDASAEGKYINGKWIKPETLDRQFYGSSFPLTTKEIQKCEAGTYTTQDIKLFVVVGLTDTNEVPLNLSIGEIITKDTTDYEITEELDVVEIAGYKKYITKKVIIND